MWTNGISDWLNFLTFLGRCSSLGYLLRYHTGHKLNEINEKSKK
ncbi:Uncharacterised protein [Vibrio cholerae]|nr:Uncharacterised protein [Vibrio cholerae]